jgi:uncharacterized membrane protein (DUF485 family)
MSDVANKPGVKVKARAIEPELTDEQLAKAKLYEELEQGEDFKELTRARRNFIIPAMIIFIVYYFGMLVLINYLPDVMDARVLGVNLAYLMALSQFILAWVIAFVYLKVSTDVFDKLVAKIVAKVKHHDDQAADRKTAKGGK